MDNQFLTIESKKDITVANKRQIDRGAVSKAIYLVTDLFEEKEPLRSALRSVAVDILKDSDKQHIVKLKSLLILSGDIGLVSEVNTKILIQAIDSIEEGYKVKKEIVDISQMFEVNYIEKESHIVEVQESHVSSVEVDKVHIDAPIKKIEKTMSQPISTVTTLDIGTRRKKILEVVRFKGQATIHEFIESIQGCSSKTIQRELTSLVLSGTLKKTGERRWSKYSLR